MKQNNSRIRFFTIMLFSLLSPSCATKLKDVESNFSLPSKAEPLKEAKGFTWVAIRFPVAIDPEAEGMINAYYAKFQNPTPSCFDTKTITSDATYYAAELYKILEKQVGKGNVVLEPQYITKKSGKLLLSPVVESKLPAVFAINYEHAAVCPIIDGGSESPVLSIGTSGMASPKTCGAVLAPMFGFYKGGQCDKLSSRQAAPAKLLEVFTSGDINREFKSSLPIREKTPFTVNELFVYKSFRDEFSDDYLKASASPAFKVKNGASNVKSLGLVSDAILQGLPNYDSDKAIHYERINNINDYDPALAAKFTSGASLSGDDQVRLNVIDKLGEYEKIWIGKQDDLLAEKIINGPFGKSFRATRLAREGAMDAYDTQNNLRLAAAALSVGAAAGAAATALSSGVQATAMQMPMQMLTMTAFNNLASLSATDSSNIQSQFYRDFGAELAVRDQVLNVDIKDHAISITAPNRAELRNELKKIYQEFIAKK